MKKADDLLVISFLFKNTIVGLDLRARAQINRSYFQILPLPCIN